MCVAIEAQEHTIQLLEALGTILPAGSKDPRASVLLTNLSCMAFPVQEALYKQLGILRLLRRGSMFIFKCTNCKPSWFVNIRNIK